MGAQSKRRRGGAHGYRPEADLLAFSLGLGAHRQEDPWEGVYDDTPLSSDLAQRLVVTVLEQEKEPQDAPQTKEAGLRSIFSPGPQVSLQKAIGVVAEAFRSQWVEPSALVATATKIEQQDLSRRVLTLEREIEELRTLLIARDAHSPAPALPATRDLRPDVTDTESLIVNALHYTSTVAEVFSATFRAPVEVVIRKADEGDDFPISIILDARQGNPVEVSQARAGGARTLFYERVAEILPPDVLDTVSFDFVFPKHAT